ncbi:hypothetical protein [Owenweeksia hongkongensis]|uniref:hypothetical protein n=1 Tax=Owenweeksia hongkongensis TaxID=253245 RepID=UPI003A931C76
MYTTQSKIPAALVKQAQKHFNRADTRHNLLKCYYVFLDLFEKELASNKKRNNPKDERNLYTYIPSAYLEKKVCKRYNTYKKWLADNDYIKVKEGQYQEPHTLGLGLYDDGRFTEAYKPGVYCKSYQVLKFPKNEDPIVEFSFNPKLSPALSKTISFLAQIGIDNKKIKYDNFGFRFYHCLYNSYKLELPKFGSFTVYDIKSSIPTFCKLEMKESNIDTAPFYELFDGDFYANWARELDLTLSRDEVKKQFSTFLYGKRNDVSPHVLDAIKSKFPAFYHRAKRNGYGQLITRLESRYMQKEIIENLPIDEALYMFDGFVIRSEFESIIDKYISNLPESEITWSKKRLLQN